MRHIFRIIGSLVVLLAQACSAPRMASPSPPLPPATETLLPSAVPFTLTPLPTSTLPEPTLTITPPIPPTPTLPAPTLIEPFDLFSNQGYPIQPSNGADEWLLYDSPQHTKVLLFDGRYLWAGSYNGGLVQWDPQTLSAVRHTHATGFPLGTVNDLAFDATNGYLYAVGDAGLAIWDGTQWQHFTSEQLGFLKSDPLTAIAVEDATTIWVGAEQFYDPHDWGEPPATFGGGLGHGNWRAGSWEHYDAPDPLMSRQINDLAIDSQGNLWVASGQYGASQTTGGVSVRDPAGTWTHWGLNHGSDGYQPDRGLDGYAFGSLVISLDGRVYAGSPHGVSWLDREAEVWQSVDASGTRQLSLDAQGNLWMATGHGLFRLDASGLQPIYQQSEYYLLGAIAVDGEGSVWFGGEMGLFRLQGNDVEQMPVLNALPDLQISDVAVNGDDTVWLRSDAGISHLVGKRIYNFTEESLAIEAAYPWTGRDSLWPVAPDGTLWLLVDRTLWGYNQSGWQIVSLDAIPYDYIQSYTTGPDGTLIVGVSSGLYIHTHEQGWRVEPYKQGFNNFDSVLYDALTNSIWASSGSSYFFPGLAMRYGLDTSEWTFFSEDNGGLIEVPPCGIGLAPDGKIWVVSTLGSIAVYNTDGTWQTITESADFLGAMGFGEVYFSNSGDVWLTTIDICGFESWCVSGLVYYDGTNWLRFTAENSGLSDNWIYDISVDSAGNAWLATSIGLQLAPLPLP